MFSIVRRVVPCVCFCNLVFSSPRKARLCSKKCSSLCEALSTLTKNELPVSYELIDHHVVNQFVANRKPIFRERQAFGNCLKQCWLTCFQLFSKNRFLKYREQKIFVRWLVLHLDESLGSCREFGRDSRYAVYLHSMTSSLMHGTAQGGQYLSVDCHSTNRRRWVDTPITVCGWYDWYGVP